MSVELPKIPKYDFKKYDVPDIPDDVDFPGEYDAAIFEILYEMNKSSKRESKKTTATLIIALATLIATVAPFIIDRFF